MADHPLRTISIEHPVKAAGDTNDSALCTTCNSILCSVDLSKLKRGDSFFAWPTIWKGIVLEDSADDGCPLCLLFLGVLSHEQREHMKRQKKNSKPVDLVMRCDVDLQRILTGNDWIKVFFLRMLHESAADLYTIGNTPWRFSDSIAFIPKYEYPIEHTLLENSTASASSLRTATVWLDHCLASHRKCNQRPVQFLPSRLIRIVVSDQRPVIQLTLKGDIPCGTRYATLSHCWGGHTPIKLVNSNFAEMINGIDISTLPKSFQDAAIVTQKLGLEFLWIDCLCIIQDSLQDWIDESSTMTDVYSNGFFSIAAAAAADARMGLFFQRDARQVRPFKAIVTSGSTTCPYYAVPTGSWRDGVEKAPLARRGWACQERILSPRTIHFGSAQLFWECRELSVCESNPWGKPEDISRDRTKRMFYDVLVPKKSIDEQTPIDKGLCAWYNVVSLYAKASLTFDIDKLVAISGLARQIQPILNTDYIAGLWRKHLTFQLTWFCPSPGRRYTTFIAPSWSWASINGEIIVPYNYDGTFQKIKIIDVQTTPLHGDLFGAVKGGFLRVQAKLALVQSGNRNKLLIVDDSELKLEGSSDCMIFPDDQESSNNPNDSGPIWLLPVAFDSETQKIRLWGLILKSTSGQNGRREFRRWGAFLMRDLYVTWLEELLKAFDKDSEARKGLDYRDDGKGGFGYDITII